MGDTGIDKVIDKGDGPYQKREKKFSDRERTVSLEWWCLFTLKKSPEGTRLVS